MRLFTSRLTDEAKTCKDFGQQISSTNATGLRTGAASSGNSGKHTTGGGRGVNSPGAKTGSGSVSKVPICLYPPHKEKGIRHKVMDCRAYPEEEKTTLIQEFVEERKRAKERNEKHLKQKPCLPALELNEGESSILFTALFEKIFRGQECADNGTDGNIMDPRNLRAIQATGADIEVENLGRPRVFEMGAATTDGNRAILTCARTLSVHTELQIRHGSALVLRNLKWLVTNQPVADPLLGRPVLEVLGLNILALLAAAAGKFSGDIDVECLIGYFDEKGDGCLSRVMEGVFHSDGGEEAEEGEETQGEWCDIGGETTQEWEQAKISGAS